MSVSKPELPFKSRFAEIDGYRMHYFDEGEGDTILLAHGIPEWSMTYSKLIKELSANFRCVIPDHLGFGLSDKPSNIDLTPKGHAERLLKFIDALKPENIHLVVHDLGGLIGIGALVQRPQLFKSLTISNTWLWNLEGTRAGSGLKMMQGFLGKWLYLSYGFSVKYMAKNAFAERKQYEEVKDIFLYPHQTREDRWANYILMLEMLNSGPYYDECLAALKTLELPRQLVWGMKDKFFPHTDYLERWKRELPGARVTTLNDSGHFPQLEAPRALAESIQRFIHGTI